MMNHKKPVEAKYSRPIQLQLIDGAKVTIYGENVDYDDEERGIKSIRTQLKDYQQTLVAIDAPYLRKEIPSDMFDSFSALEYVTMAQVRRVGENAFRNCTKLKLCYFAQCREIKKNCFRFSRNKN